jgi:uncharacterized damage-inducible protein DinB
MPTSDVLQILLAHDRWSTAQMLDACARLTPDQFHRRFEIGHGSLHDTLAHVIAALRALTDTLAGSEPRPRVDGDGRRRTPGELRALLEASYDEFAAEASRRPLEETVTRTMRTGRTLTLTRGAALVHVTTHGTHHRAQCLNMLRHLGVTPLPPSSVAEWTWIGDAQR